MDWGSFGIDLRRVTVLGKVVNSSGKGNFFVGTFPRFCSHNIDESDKFIICVADNNLKRCI